MEHGDILRRAVGSSPLADAVESGDLAALGSIGFQRGDLEYAERHLVYVAREAGRSWADIGDVLGISRQAAWKKFGAEPPARAAAESAGEPLPGL